jgi:hypothetical protein
MNENTDENKPVKMTEQELAKLCQLLLKYRKWSGNEDANNWYDSVVEKSISALHKQAESSFHKRINGEINDISELFGAWGN